MFCPTAAGVDSEQKGEGKTLVQYIPESKLYKSQPNPYMFGNAANERNKNWTSQNWLVSRFHFSFAEYRDHTNSNFGVLRVLNDDLVQANRGFGEHPHRNMEILTYVVEGALTHKDSMGNSETLGRGSVQFMTAGTGVSHSEHNLDKTKPLRFIQIWIRPERSGLKPNYGSVSPTAEQRKNAWLHLGGHNSQFAKKAKDPSAAGPLFGIAQDCNISVTELDEGKSVAMTIGAGRQAYLVCVEGTFKLESKVNAGDDSGEEKQMNRHDAIKIKGPTNLQINANKGATHALILEMKAEEASSGYW